MYIFLCVYTYIYTYIYNIYIYIHMYIYIYIIMSYIILYYNILYHITIYYIILYHIITFIHITYIQIYITWIIYSFKLCILIKQCMLFATFRYKARETQARSWIVDLLVRFKPAIGIPPLLQFRKAAPTHTQWSADMPGGYSYCSHYCLQHNTKIRLVSAGC